MGGSKGVYKSQGVTMPPCRCHPIISPPPYSTLAKEVLLCLAMMVSPCPCPSLRPPPAVNKSGSARVAITHPDSASDRMNDNTTGSNHLKSNARHSTAFCSDWSYFYFSLCLDVISFDRNGFLLTQFWPRWILLQTESAEWPELAFSSFTWTFLSSCHCL